MNMKKGILYLSIFVIALGTTSCQKNYNCTCTVTDSSGGHAVYQEEIRSTKKNKQANCEAIAPDSDFGKVCTVD